MEKKKNTLYSIFKILIENIAYPRTILKSKPGMLAQNMT